jgi:hypothetical protein
VQNFLLVLLKPMMSASRAFLLLRIGSCSPTSKNPLIATSISLPNSMVTTAKKAQADVLLHRLHYALPGWDAAAERRDAQDEFHSAAQATAWADGDFDADHGLAFDGVGRPAH